MKALAIFISSLALCVILYAQSDIYNIAPVREQTQRLLAARSTAAKGEPFDLEQLKLLHRALVANRWMISKMPAPMLDGIRQEVEPLREVAKDLAKSPNEHERYYGAVLNSHLVPTDESRSLLVELAYDDQGGTASTALNTLFELKLDTPELRADLVAALEENPPRLGKRSTFRSMARKNIGEWGIAEAVPGLMRILEDRPADSGPIDGHAVVQLRALGPKARDALPLLERLLEERKAAGNADFREIEALESAVRLIGAPVASSKKEDTPLPAIEAPVPPEKATGSVGVSDQERGEPSPVPADAEESFPAKQQPAFPGWWALAGFGTLLLVALGLWFKARETHSPQP